MAHERLGQEENLDSDPRWVVIQEGIRKLTMISNGSLVQNLSTKERMSIYAGVYTMCINKPRSDYPRILYQKYKDCFDGYLNSEVLPSLKEKQGEWLLREFDKRWADHKLMVTWLSHIFYYLERFYIRFHKLPKLIPAGRARFHDLVFQDFKSKAADAVLALIEQERQGEKVDRALIKNVVGVFLDIKGDSMECYKSGFEEMLLLKTEESYSGKALGWIVEDSCPDYMLKVEECLENERIRVSHYLHSSSETKLLKRVRDVMLVKHMSTLLLEKEDSGCLALLREDRVDDLSRMYRLFERISEGLKLIIAALNQHVSSEGRALFKQARDAMSLKVEKKTGGTPEIALVAKMIELHDKYMGRVKDCFSNNHLFDRAVREAFEAFCNESVCEASIAEILALYCDDILKSGGSEKLSYEAIDETLDKVVRLLTYVVDKDLCFEFYRKKLSRRLLFNRHADYRHERSVLMKLKELRGCQSTSKMEGMLNDMTLSKENQNKFQYYLSKNLNVDLGMEFTVNILTTEFWPTYKSSGFILPNEMLKCVAAFKEFYKTNANNRKLTWIYSLGTCNVNAKFEEKTIELIVSTYQAAVLLLFNTEDRLSYADIKTGLNLEDEDLVRLLHSLSCAKYNILNKEPDTKSVSRDDYFEFNSKFTNKMRRIRIPLPPIDERKKVVEVVENDRRLSIDAAVIRIMKCRKVLDYQQLIAETIEHLRSMFKPDIKEIKKRIESLQTREYLERDKKNPSMFRYVG